MVKTGLLPKTRLISALIWLKTKQFSLFVKKCGII